MSCQLPSASRTNSFKKTRYMQKIAQVDSDRHGVVWHLCRIAPCRASRAFRNCASHYFLNLPCSVIFCPGAGEFRGLTETAPGVSTRKHWCFWELSFAKSLSLGPLIVAMALVIQLRRLCKARQQSTTKWLSSWRFSVWTHFVVCSEIALFRKGYDGK